MKRRRMIVARLMRRRAELEARKVRRHARPAPSKPRAPIEKLGGFALSWLNPETALAAAAAIAKRAGGGRP